MHNETFQTLLKMIPRVELSRENEHLVGNGSSNCSRRLEGSLHIDKANGVGKPYSIRGIMGVPSTLSTQLVPYTD